MCSALTDQANTAESKLFICYLKIFCGIKCQILNEICLGVMPNCSNQEFLEKTYKIASPHSRNSLQTIRLRQFKCPGRIWPIKTNHLLSVKKKLVKTMQKGLWPASLEEEWLLCKIAFQRTCITFSCRPRVFAPKSFHNS